MGGSRLEVTGYCSGDEEAINALYNETFRTSRSLDLWRWKFQQIPLNHLVVIRSLKRDGEIVGHGASIPACFKLGAREVLAGHMVDFGRRPSVRFDMSLYRLNRALERNLRETWIGQGMAFVYGFPNDKAYRFHKRIAGARDFLEIPVWMRWLNPYGYVMGRISSKTLQVVGRRMSGAYRSLRSHAAKAWEGRARGIVPLPEPDERLDRLWEEVSPCLGIAVRRDRSHVAWRYYGKPGMPYSVWLLEGGGKPLGYAVTVIQEEDVRVGYIVDVLCRPDRTEELLEAVIERLALSGADLVRCLAVAPSRLAGALKELGFRKEAGGVRVIGLVFDRSLDPDDLFDPRNWHITYGDLDGM